MDKESQKNIVHKALCTMHLAAEEARKYDNVKSVKVGASLHFSFGELKLDVEFEEQNDSQDS